MKKFVIVFMVFLTTFVLIGCGSGYTDTYQEGFYAGRDEGYDEGYDNGYDAGYDEGYDTGHGDGYDEGYNYGYSDESMYFEDVINYYENLCDYYGYQTYDSVYNPELWKYYVDTETNIAHNDWLCSAFTHSHKYFQTTKISPFDDYIECSECVGTTVVFLDEGTGVFHSKKRNLDLGTEDYIYCDVNYRLVSMENALLNGFSRCDCCDFD